MQFSTNNALKLGLPQQQNQTIKGTNALIETVILQSSHRSLSFIQKWIVQLGEFRKNP